MARAVVDIIEERKGEHIVLLDLRPDAIIADFFILATGTSDRQLRALGDYVREGVKEKYGKVPLSQEGTPESGWLLLDYGAVVIHLFTPEKREYYDLHGLWSKNANVLLSIQ
jgi:ribosome-associated protein